MLHPPAAVPSAAPVSPTAADGSERCVTLTLDDADRDCVVRLDGTLDRAAVARLEAVLSAAETLPWGLVVDLGGARTRDRRLLRLLAEVAARRRRTGRDLVLRGAHPDIVPEFEAATLPELFLVYRSVCHGPVAPVAPVARTDEPAAPVPDAVTAA